MELISGLSRRVISRSMRGIAPPPVAGNRHQPSVKSTIPDHPTLLNDIATRFLKIKLEMVKYLANEQTLLIDQF